MRSEVVEALASWLARYGVVGAKVGAKPTRPMAWWALVLRQRLNLPSITVDEFEVACARVGRVQVDVATGKTNLLAGRSLSLFDGGIR
jgi:hypothetical protein